MTSKVLCLASASSASIISSNQQRYGTVLRLSTITFVTLVVLSASYVDDATAADLSKRPDSWFGSDEGRRTIACILSWQSDHGDWPKNTDSFFCDRDGVPKYTLKEIGSERRNGYAWYGNWGDSLAAAYVMWPHR